MRLFTISLSILLASLLSGCGNLNSIHRSLSPGEGALIDIKQRAIIAGRPNGNSAAAVVCSEPSPDATAAYALEAAAKADKFPAEFALAAQETAAYNGLRTSSIQLLRDQLFNNCLSYMNGAIDKAQFDLMARRYQKQAVAMLAIEQLTGAMKASPVLLTTSGSAQLSGKSLAELNKTVIDIEKEIADLTAKLGQESDAGKKSALEQQIKLANDRRAGFLKEMDAKLATSGSTSASVQADMAKNAVAQSIAEVVRDISRDFVLTDDTPQLCLLRLASKDESSQALAQLCERYFSQSMDAMKVEIDIAKKKLALIDTSALSPKEKVQELEKLDLSGIRFRALSAEIKVAPPTLADMFKEQPKVDKPKSP
ncbi:hypothetical protein [Delftia sp. zbq_16]|uniref:hypothetical protein n=1 Tax=Delftia sp. zbq_16 TaxID=3414429 RepID=UPI003C2C21A8